MNLIPDDKNAGRPFFYNFTCMFCSSWYLMQSGIFNCGTQILRLGLTPYSPRLKIPQNLWIHSNTKAFVLIRWLNLALTFVQLSTFFLSHWKFVCRNLFSVRANNFSW
jgi:hypothetical protein